MMLDSVISFFGGIFGSDKSINKGLELLDDAIFTDEEKKEALLKLIEARQGFKLTQRLVTIVFLFNFSVTYLTCFFMQLVGYQIDHLIAVINAFHIGYIMITIILFYFGGGTLESLKSAVITLKKGKQ